ncbi:MAG: MFS transporter [Lachnospiraceae bacterium]|nr:MFS transporter [Lachnospiraceae bacterium]
MEKEKKKINMPVGELVDLIFAQATKGTGICFYLLMMYASYIANEAYGIPVALAGMIITGTRIFDGITDPIVSAIFDRIKFKKIGKIRFFNLVGWAIAGLACVLMYHWAAGKFSGTMGVIVFIIIYVMYIIGYTMKTMAGAVVGIAITRDPKVRSLTQLVGTCYQYFVPMIFQTFIAFAVLPRYDDQYNAAMLKEACYWHVLGAFILLMLSFIGLRRVDKPEMFESLNSAKGKKEKITFRDMVNLLKGNRPMQMWVITGASDKLASQTASTSIVLTIINGILIGNYQASTMMGNFTTIASLAFLAIGSVYNIKYGAKRTTRDWSWYSIIISVVMIVFCVILGPHGMSSITVNPIPTIIYIVLMLLLTGTKMTLTSTSMVMRADVVDYWMSETGDYMPGTVSGVYSLIDKIIGSFSTTVAAFCIAFIGYKNVMPQKGDPVTTPLFVMGLFLMFGLPVLGWVCNIVAMKFYKLDKATMERIQADISERKAQAKAEKAKEQEEAYKKIDNIVDKDNKEEQ